MAKPEIYFLYSSKPRRLVCRIDRPTKKGTYYLLKPLQRRRGQHEYVGHISLSGFTSLPSGLKRDGSGLPSSGYLLLKGLSEKLGKFKLTLDNSAGTSLDNRRVVLNHDDLRTLLRRMRTIKAERFQEMSGTVQSFLHSGFPSTFEEPEKGVEAEYRPNTIADILGKGQTLNKLSKDDIAAVGDFFPQFIHKYGAVGSGKKKLFILSGSKRATEVIYIRNIIADFERRLATKTQSEQSWQDFLRDYILLFNSNYATVLEKENIAVLGTRFPDFILIDAYSYLDIYEIKKPTTNLLKKDESRGNYYWDVELTKAISQVENYISHADRNAGQLCAEIKRQKEREVRVIKPRGFIIAGTRSQLQDEIMEDNFRLLNNSLKNLSIILFDELLDNLKNFLSKLKRD
jgi:hypothetical protein